MGLNDLLEFFYREPAPLGTGRLALHTFEPGRLRPGWQVPQFVERKGFWNFAQTAYLQPPSFGVDAAHRFPEINIERAVFTFPGFANEISSQKRIGRPGFCGAKKPVP